MNFARDVVEAGDPGRRGMVTIARGGARREWTMGEVAAGARALAGELGARGVARGDVVLTLLGNRPEWVLTMVACFRAGFVVLPCTEQLRPKDLRLRLDVARPRLVVADERNADALAAAGWDGPVLWAPWRGLPEREVPPAAELGPLDPCLITFTSGTAGEPKAVLHGQRYLAGQHLQAEHWLAPGAGELVWCTAASGWSKSARNAFIAPWLRGAAALLHDARFDPHERLELVEREGVERALHGADRVPRDREARRAAPGPLAARPGRRRRGARPRDPRRVPRRDRAVDPRRLRPDRDRPAHRHAARRAGAARLDGPAAAGRRAPTSSTASSSSIPSPIRRSSCTTRARSAAAGPWRTGDRVRADDDGFLYFEGRTDDVIISAGYRIGPFEVESALCAHPAVADAAVVAAPDAERGSVVRAVVVLRDGHAPSDALAAALQDHVKAETAPYKYPRIVDFASDLPRTPSGKLRRAALRKDAG